MTKEELAEIRGRDKEKPATSAGGRSLKYFYARYYLIKGFEISF
ncbi:hypothetical protein UFO1_2276 [Pelosinus sp. UFO1]|nr:hypothetical protein UFO1_2276 [Pelosinus sp. UFO1]